MGAIAAGTTVGQYEILARLKSGGMATLYRARRVGAAGFKRHVAIKVVHEHLAEDRAFVRMFVDEALLQARIHHPNVVHVEELGELGGQHFLVMEYVHGTALAGLMGALARKARRLTPEIATHIAIQVAAGLHAAHELRDEHGQLLGVVHRDVSPQNVLLAYEGHVKLIDFGVAKARNRDTTIGGSLKGKLRYMAPEQALSKRGVDRRSDVYALGIVLWEMLTHRRCFSADDDLELLELVRSPRIAPPSSFVPDVPHALDAVVMKALAPAPEDRYQTAQELRRALAQAVPGAMLIDASHVAELLAAAMADEIERDRSQLPDSVSGVVANEQRLAALGARSEEALRTMTVSGAGIAYLADTSEAQPPSGSGVRVQHAPPASISATLPTPVSAPPASSQPRVAAASAPAPERVTPVPVRRALPVPLIVGAVMVAIASVAAVIGAALVLGRRGGDTMVATPLAAPMPQAPPAPGASAPGSADAALAAEQRARAGQSARPAAPAAELHAAPLGVEARPVPIAAPPPPAPAAAPGSHASATPVALPAAAEAAPRAAPARGTPRRARRGTPPLEGRDRVPAGGPPLADEF